MVENKSQAMKLIHTSNDSKQSIIQDANSNRGNLNVLAPTDFLNHNFFFAQTPPVSFL